MALTLAIENELQLPDGGPTSIQISGRRGIDIGRDQHLDWTLPDPDRVISGKHCEIRYHDGAFWLHDLSRNGTFVNGSDRRLHEPHRLRNGDRIEIGRYIISVRLDGQEAEPPPVVPAQNSVRIDDIWDDATDAPPPIPSADLRVPPQSASSRPDFLDWVVDLPEVTPDEPAFRPAGRAARSMPSWDEPSQSRGPEAGPAQRRTDFGSNSFGPPQPDHDAPAQSSSLPPSRSEVPSLPRHAEDWGAKDAADKLMRVAAEARALAQPDAGDFLQRLARGVGIPPEILAGREAGDVAEELGLLMRIVAENLKQLLIARAESRRMVRGSRQTMIQAFDNNPIKFCPTVDDALRIILGPRTRGYLDAQETLKQSFDDLKSHQLATFLAMQKAVELMMEPFDPKAIEEATARRGLIGSRKAALWDAYVALWEGVLAEHDNGFIDAFVSYFSQYYQRGEKDS